MLRALHKPESIEETHLAKKTIFFKRLLRLQLVSQQEKNTYQADSTLSQDMHTPQRDVISTFLETLPFELT
jgi:RecG-like helicase